MQNPLVAALTFIVLAAVLVVCVRMLFGTPVTPLRGWLAIVGGLVIFFGIPIVMMKLLGGAGIALLIGGALGIFIARAFIQRVGGFDAPDSQQQNTVE